MRAHMDVLPLFLIMCLAPRMPDCVLPCMGQRSGQWPPSSAIHALNGAQRLPVPCWPQDAASRDGGILYAWAERRMVVYLQVKPAAFSACVATQAALRSPCAVVLPSTTQSPCPAPPRPALLCVQCNSSPHNLADTTCVRVRVRRRCAITSHA
jgi:hypothetical protein